MLNELASLPRLSEWVKALSDRAAYGDRDRFRIEMTVTEAVTNVISNAFPSGGVHEISLVAQQAPTLLAISILDYGLPFDPVSHPKRRSPHPLRMRRRVAWVCG